MTGCTRVPEKTGVEFVVVMEALVRQDINHLINLMEKVSFKEGTNYKHLN